MKEVSSTFESKANKCKLRLDYQRNIVAKARPKLSLHMLIAIAYVSKVSLMIS
jgi:hypothetical protein